LVGVGVRVGVGVSVGTGVGVRVGACVGVSVGMGARVDVGDAGIAVATAFRAGVQPAVFPATTAAAAALAAAKKSRRLNRQPFRSLCTANTWGSSPAPSCCFVSFSSDLVSLVIGCLL
jgi:hypothetical protein